VVRALNFERRTAIDCLATLCDRIEFWDNLRGTFQTERRNRVAIAPDNFLAITDNTVGTIASDCEFDRKHEITSNSVYYTMFLYFGQ
jgi:hypothetical protein